MTLLIKNAYVIDGTGKPAYKSDVLIKKEKISAIKPQIDYKADNIIDGKGFFLCPGFININSYADHRLKIFNNSSIDFLLQGVTTIIGGQKGISLAPLLSGSLEPINHKADLNKINVNWRTFGEFLNVFKKHNFGINFGSFIGHTTIRKELVGKSARNLSENEFKLLIILIEKSLQEGAFGISIDLSNPIIEKASYFELKKIAEITAKYKKTIAFNLKNRIIKPTKKQREEFFDSIKKIIFLGKETGANILINNFYPIAGLEKDFDAAVELIKKNSSSANINFNLHPYPQSVLLLRDLLPEWAKNIDKEYMIANISKEETRNKILKELPLFRGEEMVIANAPTRNFLKGKTLKEFSKNRNLNIREGLLELMKLTEFRAEIIYKNISSKKSIKTLALETAFVASCGLPQEFFKPFKEFLKIIEREKVITMEQAIKKLTYLPAQKIGLWERGEIKEGNYADLLLFKNGEIKDVIINGKIVLKDGDLEKEFAGKILKADK